MPSTLRHAVPACGHALFAAGAPAPARLTLDQLRADLSHEMAAKFARLAGYLQQWRDGSFDDDDASSVADLLARTEALHRRHARVAAGDLRSFGQLVRVLTLLGALRATMARAARADTDARLRAEQLLPQLVTCSRALVELLSARYGARFGELVVAAAEQIRREAATAGADGVPVAIESADGGAAAWVPRADAARWSDVLGNLIRNAIQATEERSGLPTPRPAVVVRLRPARAAGGACVEVLDEGVGMTADQVARMWHDGATRHGEGHGQGLTAAKRTFVEQQAALEVRSAPGVGTCVRLDLAPRDLAFRPPRRRVSLPLVLPLMLLIGGGALAATRLYGGQMVGLRISDNFRVEAIDGRGRVVWHRELPAHVLRNTRSRVQTDYSTGIAEVPPLVLPDRDGRPLAVLATAPDQGPGRLTAHDGRGAVRWSRPLTWTPPRVRHTGKLNATFEAATVWNDGDQPAIVIGVRDDNWGDNAIQFLDLDGNRLGEYLHPGSVELIGTVDLDADGRRELLLTGRNNDAARLLPFAGEVTLPDSPYIECLILLETPNVDGQAFPARRWDAVAWAREKAYLLIPPLTVELLAWPDTTRVTRIPAGVRDADGQVRVEAYLADGRIYTLDGDLRPLACTVGDRTTAARLAPTRAAAPLLYFREGQCDTIDLPVKRGP